MSLSRRESWSRYNDRRVAEAKRLGLCTSCFKRVCDRGFIICVRCLGRKRLRYWRNKKVWKRVSKEDVGLEE